jgi:CrcB protein
VPELLVVALGGALGAVCRWQVGGWAQRHWIGHATWGHLPLGTLVVNVIGCLILGALAGVTAEAVPPRWRLAVGTGFLGSFTTFSTFGVETVRLAQDGMPMVAAANLALQLGCGLGAAMAGMALGRALAG